MLLEAPFSGWEFPSVPHYKGMVLGAPGNVLQVVSWTLGSPAAPSALFALPNCVFSADLRGAALPPFCQNSTWCIWYLFGWGGAGAGWLIEGLAQGGKK